MRHFIFITTEGYTFQPDSEFSEPDIENCQVLGFGSGTNSRRAFKDFKSKNSWLNDTTFNQAIAYELKHSDKHSEYFYLKRS